MNLAMRNKTTIENLENKGNKYESDYDIGDTKNWEQIFGYNRWLWPFPVFCSSGKPLGDGITWPMNKEKALAKAGKTADAEKGALLN